MRPLVLVLSVLLASCGSCSSSAPAPPPPQANAAPALLDQTLVLDGTGAEPFVRRFELDVAQNEMIAVSVTSAQFDPFLQVTPPNAATLSNDDYLGNRQQSSLTILPTSAGRMHITVSSARRGSSGSFRVVVQRLAAAQAQVAALHAGSTLEGTAGPGDATLPDGRPYDQLTVQVEATPLSLRVEPSGAVAPTVIVSDPTNTVLAPAQGGGFTLVSPGLHRVQILAVSAAAPAGYRVAVTQAAAATATTTLARAHHQIPPQGTERPVSIGDIVKGTLDSGDGRLPSGETFDAFALNLPAGSEEVVLELTSSELDPYLLVVGPDGNHFENDGAGALATVRVTPTVAGAYRVIATSFDSAGHGSYSLKVSPGSREVAVAPPVAANGAAPIAPETIRGTLERGDSTLTSGELFDEHRFTFAAGDRVHMEARSTAFDTYLIARPPQGDQIDNDDQSEGNHDAALDFTAIAGEYRVLVTSYRAGETGDYELSLGPSGGALSDTAAPAVVEVRGDTTRGALAAGDRTLQSGELSDTLTMHFDAGEPVELRLSSTAFDPYLIVRSPSGNQLDNDDLTPASHDAGISIPVAEAGEYSIIVTSYSAGETGAYVLTRSRGTAIPRPGGGGRGVAGLFVGISDYPGEGDLPECANDALKLAEALRERGLLSADRQIVLTDAQATTTNIRNALTTMAQQLGPDDVFLFFYSGHGGQRGGSTDPREIDQADEYLAVYDGPLLDDEVGRLYDGIHARLAIIALDSCYSGGFAKDVVTAPHRVGLFSSEEDVLSAVASQFQAGGYLSHFLRTGVGGDADAQPADGVLTVGELTHFVYAQFGAHAADVQLASAYQHLVVDRGAVRVDEVLWSYR